MFRTVHAINIHARSATDFIWMNKLDTMKGLEIGGTYSGNTKNCREFASVIADVQRTFQINLVEVTLCQL